ncbi:MAG: iron export ABC transporter permease subunit FetB [Myxococcota bacterium]
MNGPVPIGDVELAAAFVLVAVAAAVSLALRLDLERRLLWASLRATVQLFVIGQILAYVLGTEPGWAIAVVMTVMIGAAAHQAVTRPERWLDGGPLGAFVTLTLVGLLTTFTVSRGLLHLEPWYTPRYALPLLGMILGNTLTGLSLSLDNLLEAADLGRETIEADLALGATRWEALREPLGRAVRVGMTPILNSTSVVGLVALPGMMTGQVLAGADPRDAVRYQLLVMFSVGETEGRVQAEA